VHAIAIIQTTKNQGDDERSKNGNGNYECCVAGEERRSNATLGGTCEFASLGQNQLKCPGYEQKKLAWQKSSQLPRQSWVVDADVGLPRIS
jgi:hypothetical protein